MKMSAQEFLDYVKETRAKSTWRMYKVGIKMFSDWFGKDADQILELRRQDWVSGDMHTKKRFTRELERFYRWMEKEGYALNTRRTNCNGILQLFRFYEMPITIPRGSDISKTVPTTKDFVPSMTQYRAMFKVAKDTRSKLIISMGKDLAWRIGDFVKVRKDQLPDLELEPPILFELITEKSDVIAKSFLSVETVQLLKEYIPTTDKKNPMLFPSKDTINRTLKRLAEKAGVKVPRNKRLRFHAFRKRFLSTCADLGIDVNIAKILCGKDVGGSMLEYLGEVKHKQAFTKAQSVLRLTDITMSKIKTKESDVIQELRDQLNEKDRLINAMGILQPDLEKKAIELLKSMNVTLAWEKFSGKLADLLKEIDKVKQEEQRKEYERIIANNNNNNNH